MPERTGERGDPSSPHLTVNLLPLMPVTMDVVLSSAMPIGLAGKPIFRFMIEYVMRNSFFDRRLTKILYDGSEIS